MIKSGLKNPDKVLEGLVNSVKSEYGLLPEDEQAEILRRRLICSDCPYMSTNAVKSGIYYTNRIDEHCMQCGCPIFSKTASLLSNCGIENYNSRHPEAPLELKWTKYEK